MNQREDIFGNAIDYKKVFQRFYYFRKTYILITILLLILAFFVNHYSPKKYKNFTILSISDADQNSFINNSSTDMMKGFGLFNDQSNIDNEIEIIKSYTVVRKVITDLELQPFYYTYKSSLFSNLLNKTPLVRKTEYYNDSPIKVVMDPSVPQAVYLHFKISFLNDNEYLIETQGDDIQLYNYIDDQVVAFIDNIFFKNRFRFGDEVKTRYFNFRIQKSEGFDKAFTNNQNLCFYFNNINFLTAQYSNALAVIQTTQTSTLLKVIMKGTHPEKITDFLNGITSVYMGRSLEKKNKIALSTINFIDSQISDIADSLSYAEANLKSFRTVHSVMDLDYQGQQVFEKLDNLESERANILVQQKYYAYLKQYLNNPDVSNILVPSSMNVVDPILTNLVTQLIALNSEKVSLLRNTTNEQNLYLADINLKIDNLKNTIKENVSNSLNTIQISLNELNYRMNALSSRISMMPKTELQLKGIERKFKLNDEIYTYLLQKRSEAQIARASSMPDYDIIETAKTAYAGLVSPKRLLNYSLAILLGLLLPTSFILLSDFLNNKISDPQEVENLSKYPILGRIFHSYRKSRTVVNDHPNSSVTECFRAVRTNFQFFSEGGKKQVLLLTSSTSGEGKTFCSMNLASVFALNGHRTALLEFDLRRPKIHQEFGSSNMIGISSYLIDKAVIEDIIMPTHIENLDLISAGPAAPNPAELISSERTAEFIDKLKEMYDYIIIDSAPAGILTETYLLMKLADLNIFIVRMDKTIKDTYKQTMKNLEGSKFTNLSILINDIDISREAFKYGYDKKYYTDDRRKGFFGKIFDRDTQAS